MGNRGRDLSLLAFFVIGCLLVGSISGFFTAGEVDTWYPSLVKPDWNPPSWLFGPVWTLLYALMGVAAFLIYKEGFEKREVKIALGIFSVQLGLNFFWSILFFTYKNLFASFVEIILLWIAILATIISFYRINRPAALIMIPYFLWVSFATLLNYTLLILN
ncbi:MAG: tryptophan-rich sensory protein [Euryarchaeota archaeon]|nr:tryptophan-rich sensory protein [Euryarchaeota archaeon]MBV1728644.1 tryptophan-rich sensory protein [Methanobacterium sp.]MBU4547470.1 tryptophan-rich sensory protein [Euryarchaeota archaeon]MBU4607206.1 tryptophan-rich sensory protein [Euryarchaeota archaeon]MBV1754543.1 tryptophan-rich sensory protein [Methanobacterium sp.]